MIKSHFKELFFLDVILFLDKISFKLFDQAFPSLFYSLILL